MVGHRERTVEVERGRQVDVSAHFGRELQMLYMDLITTYRRCTLWLAREKGKWKWRVGRQVDISAHVGWGGDRGGSKENGREVYFMSSFSSLF